MPPYGYHQDTSLQVPIGARTIPASAELRCSVMRLLPTLSSPTGVSLNCVAQERSRKMTPVPLKTFQSSQNKSQFSTIVLELQITPISLLPISLASSLHGSDRLVVVESSPLIVKTAIHIDVKGNLPPPEQSKENRLPLPHPPQEAKTRQKPMHSEGERERIEVMRAWSRITAIVPSSSSSTFAPSFDCRVCVWGAARTCVYSPLGWMFFAALLHGFPLLQSKQDRRCFS
jgi:hypothetical protein